MFGVFGIGAVQPLLEVVYLRRVELRLRPARRARHRRLVRARRLLDVRQHVVYFYYRL